MSARIEAPLVGWNEPRPPDDFSFLHGLDHDGRALRRVDFDRDPSPAMLGDVVLCPEVATQQAREAHRPVEAELEMLCTHGILHLLGFDHAEPGERATMFGLQDRLLDSWRADRAAGRAVAEGGESG